MEVVRQPPFLAVDHGDRVDDAFETNLVRLEKPHDPDGIDAAMPDPAAAEEILVAQTICRRLQRCVCGDTEQFVPAVPAGLFHPHRSNTPTGS